jgi:pilus assembly protein TadC
MRRNRASRLIALTGMTLLLSAFMVMFSIFMAAYLSPAKMAIIHVNTLNEAPIELALLLSTSVLGFYAFALLFKDFRNLRINQYEKQF